MNTQLKATEAEQSLLKKLLGQRGFQVEPPAICTVMYSPRGRRVILLSENKYELSDAGARQLANEFDQQIPTQGSKNSRIQRPLRD